ncbi:MAG: iduronate sulfatase, partial [Verrucomicrobiales bacterium]
GANLHAGKGSYLEFVVDIETAGTYSLGATLSVEASCIVLVDDVVDDAAQADTGYAMQTVGTVEPTGELEEVTFGRVPFDQPGLKLIRLMSNVRKQQLQIDRLRIRKLQP